MINNLHKILIVFIMAFAIVIAPLSSQLSVTGDMSMDHTQMSAADHNMAEYMSIEANCKDHCVGIIALDMDQDCMSDCMQNGISHVAYLSEAISPEQHSLGKLIDYSKRNSSHFPSRFITPPPRA